MCRLHQLRHLLTAHTTESPADEHRLAPLYSGTHASGNFVDNNNGAQHRDGSIRQRRLTFRGNSGGGSANNESKNRNPLHVGHSGNAGSCVADVVLLKAKIGSCNGHRHRHADGCHRLRFVLQTCHGPPNYQPKVKENIV